MVAGLVDGSVTSLVSFFQRSSLLGRNMSFLGNTTL